jgi:hypothetical protein
MLQIERIYFLPPLAIARVGGSDTPLDCFVWDSDRTIHGTHRTVIRPAVSLEVIPDGSLRPYLPSAIQFRDQGLLRPVAPFFELWATLSDGKSQPLTSALLAECGASTDNVQYIVTVANRKAQRRTGSASCAYMARVNVSASDHERKPLLAFSPHTSGEEPLVYKDHPIPLGHFQAIKPIPRLAKNIHLDALRVRFTPAKGQVYGTPAAISGPASPLPQGYQLPPVTEGGRLHEIVPAQNRILNPATPWSEHFYTDQGSLDPQPSDSYDGANVGKSVSWGVVDDTCDGVIEAHVVIKNIRHVATARVLSSCPDFAPDRRPFYSMADDLADRDLPPIDIEDDPGEDAQYEIADLFERAFETVSLYNLDALRKRSIAENLMYPLPQQDSTLPQMDYRSMTAADSGKKDSNSPSPPPYADLTADLFPYPEQPGGNTPGFQLPYAAAAQAAHAKLCDIETLIDFLTSKADRVEKLVRPPFGRFSELKKRPTAKPNERFRDMRVERDTYHDMRMPPYMRDSDLNPLSITHRQYDALRQLIENLKSPDVMAGRAVSPIARQIADMVKLADKKKS